MTDGKYGLHLSNLLEKMSATDTDFRFMAINDLINDLQNESLRLDTHNENIIIKSILNLLRDPNLEVRSLAVTALSVVSTRVSLVQISKILQDLLDSMVNSDEGQIRSLSGIGLKSVISAMSSTNVSLINAVTNESVKPLLSIIYTHSDIAVRIEACEILSEMLPRFGSSMLPQHNEILQCLLISISNSNSSLRKRIVQVISNLIWIASSDSYTSLLSFILHRFNAVRSTSLNANAIISIISKNNGLQHPLVLESLRKPISLDEFKTLLQCISVLARNPERFANQVPNLLQSILHLLASPTEFMVSITPERQDNNDEHLDEIRELGILVIDTLVRRSSWLITPSIAEVVNMFLLLLKHDPNYSYADQQYEGMDDEPIKLKSREMELDDEEAPEDEDDGFNDDTDEEDENYDDASWKVRRAAAKALEACISSFPDYLITFYRTIAPNLITCLRDRNESVRLDVCACLSALLCQTRMCRNLSVVEKSLSALRKTSVELEADDLQARLLDPDSPQSLLLQLLPNIFASISLNFIPQEAKKGRLRSSSVKIGVNCKQAVFVIFRDLALALPGHLSPYLGIIFNLIQTDFSDQTTSNTAKIEMVRLLILILKTHQWKHLKEHSVLLLKLTIVSISDSFYRVALDGLDLVHHLATLQPKGSSINLNELFPALVNQLKANNCDLELKEKAVSTAAVYLQFVGNVLSSNEVNQCLELILLRLKNELTRLVAVHALGKIFVANLKIDLNEILTKSIAELSVFLSKQDRALRIATLHCLTSICEHYPSNLAKSENLTAILASIPGHLSENDWQISQATIQLVASLLQISATDSRLQDQMVKLVTGDQFLDPLVNLVHSNLIHGPTLDSVRCLMQCIGHFGLQNSNGKLTISFILSRLLKPLKTCDQTTRSLHNQDALPHLAKCIAELLAQLPVTTLNAEVGSIDTAVDQLISVITTEKSPPVHRYLNLLVLGELGRKLNLSARKDLLQLLLDYVTMANRTIAEKTDGATQLASEMRPIAAIGLGRLVVGDPETLLPFIIDNINTVVNENKDSATGFNNASANAFTQQLEFYYLLHALKEALVNLLEADNTACIRKHLDALWSMLLLNAGRNDEGSRNLVAECLGKLSLLSPQILVSRLQTQLNSPDASTSALTRATIVTAAKFILVSKPTCLSIEESNEASSRSCSSADDVHSALCVGQPPALVDFLSRLLDCDITVRKAALVTLNTAVHHRPNLVRPLLNQPVISEGIGGTAECPTPPSILDLLYRETVVRKELIREVQMGPFTHKEDDGLELRKSAYECMSTLLDSCIDCLHMSTFLDSLINGLKDNFELKLLAYHILQRVIQLRPLEVAHKMEALSGPLKADLSLRPQTVSVKLDLDKIEELKRCVIVVIIDFRILADIEKNHYYTDLLRTIESDASLKTIYDQFVCSVEKVNRSSSLRGCTTPQACQIKNNPLNSVFA